MRISAAVAHEVGAPFTLAEVDLEDPAPDEVLVQIAGVGICHTDIAVKEGHLPFPLPGVLGHEGSGTVVSVGADVTAVTVGDHVAISFNSCDRCPRCAKGEPAYCHNFLEYNFSGVRSDGSSGLASAGTKLGANFFGQSSLATHALAHQRNVVKLPPDVPVELVGPLGCGIQTGAGAVFNSLDVQPGSTVVIAGAGAVGLSAVMAAVVRDAASIIAVDLHESRRALATEVGATHVVDPQADLARRGVPIDVDDLRPARVLELEGGRPVVIDIPHLNAQVALRAVKQEGGGIGYNSEQLRGKDRRCESRRAHQDTDRTERRDGACLKH